MIKLKGVPIKFRGKRIVCDDWAYGDLKHEYGNETWIDDCEVDPDSVE